MKEFYIMEKADKNIKADSRIFKNTVIDNDLKKYQQDPLVVKQADKAIQLLSKVKNLQNIL